MEAYGVNKELIARKINEAGVNCIVEGYNHSTRRHWKIVTDASLTGSDAFEIVSPILQGADGMEELRKVTAVLEAANVKINKTCGMHIHFDATGFGVEQVKNLLLNYTKFEDQIDSFMPNSRRGSNNQYCRSLRGYEARVEKSNNDKPIGHIIWKQIF